MIPEDAMRKIRKCLALSASSEPAEAEAAMRQAQKLMDAHGVTEDALDRAAVKTAYAQGRAGQKPSEWENRLVWLCCEAFGGKPLWVAGPKGGKGDRDNGWWMFLAEGERAELIKYTYAVLVRQVLAGRAKRANELPYYRTRPQKAAYLDDYCAAFVSKLASKVAPHALSERSRAALDAAVAEQTDPKNPKAGTRDAPWAFGAALRDGLDDGAAASFHAAAKGRDPQLQIKGA